MGAKGLGSFILAGAAACLTLAAVTPVRPALAQDQGGERVVQQRMDERDLQDRLRRDAGRAVVDPAAPRGGYNIGTPHPTEASLMAAEREAELRRLTEKLRRAGESRRERSVASGEPTSTPWSVEVTPAPQAELDTSARVALGAPASADTAIDRRATVLLVMAPGDRGIRRLGPSADPILCVADGCYLSEGPERAATFLPLRRALGPVNTIGRRAAACSGQLACVFRDIELSAGSTTLQPVDIRVLRHDMRQHQSVSKADDTCVVAGGRLTCARAIRGPNYTMWVLPERVARTAGADVLKQALADNLPGDRRSAELPWLR